MRTLFRGTSAERGAGEAAPVRTALRSLEFLALIAFVP
jgi:hypothetical protein